MMDELVFIISSALLGVGLAADAFAVSLADGITEPHMRRGKLLVTAGTFALFQALMPLIGRAAILAAVGMSEHFAAAADIIAPVLLFFIGGKSIWDAIHSDPDSTAAEGARLDAAALLGQAAATSIDALSAGFAYADCSRVQAAEAAAVIGAVTFVICVIGLYAGRRAGMRLAGKARYIGGGILILIGVKLLFGV